jgi:hypothetical protein
MPKTEETNRILPSFPVPVADQAYNHMGKHGLSLFKFFLKGNHYNGEKHFRGMVYVMAQYVWQR